jgi:hypothetical protein
MIKCIKCKEIFETLEAWESHNKSCGSYGYEKIRVKKQSNIKVDKSKQAKTLQSSPKKAELQQADIVNKDAGEKISKVLTGSKPKKAKKDK